MFRDIDIYASKLTQMESKTRYLKSYSVAVREIKLGFDLANGIIDKLTKLEEAEDAQNAIEHEDS
jgi:hypothetical protein